MMLASFLPPTSKGGVGYQVTRLADALTTRGHAVTVFSFSDPPPDSLYMMKRLKAGEHACSTGLGKLLAVPAVFALGSYRDTEIIHAHGDSHLVVRRGTPVVRTFYGSAAEEARHAERLRRKLSQRAYAIAEGLARHTATVTVGISHNSLQSLGALDAVIPCGVDRKLFRPGTKSAHPSVLFVGTVGGRKRGHLVVEAFRQVVRPQMPDAELWMVADRPVTGEGIRCWDRPSDEIVADLYRRAWVLVHPSSYEGFGVPYIEAMASGTPIVATPNAGSREVVAGQGAGWIVEPPELGSATLALLGDPVTRAGMQEAGRRQSESYGWDQVAARYEDAYHLALERKSSPRPGRALR